MSETPRTDAMQIFLWQHDETGRTCWMKTSPGPRWNRVGVPALCLLDDARQLERDLTAERERADRNQEDAERWRAAELLFEAGYEMEDGSPAIALFLPEHWDPNEAIDAARRK